MKKFIPFYGMYVCHEEIMNGKLDSDDIMYTLTAAYHGGILALITIKIILCVT